jgi:hypothetical protein
MPISHSPGFMPRIETSRACCEYEEGDIARSVIAWAMSNAHSNSLGNGHKGHKNRIEDHPAGVAPK